MEILSRDEVLRAKAAAGSRMRAAVLLNVNPKVLIKLEHVYEIKKHEHEDIVLDDQIKMEVLLKGEGAMTIAELSRRLDLPIKQIAEMVEKSDLLDVKPHYDRDMWILDLVFVPACLLRGEW